MAQALDVWFIHLPQIVKLLVSRTILHCDTGLRQHIPQSSQTGGRQAIRRQHRLPSSDKNLGQVGDGVTSHGKRQLRLTCGAVFMPAMIRAHVSRIAVSAASHDWFVCCERK